MKNVKANLTRLSQKFAVTAITLGASGLANAQAVPQDGDFMFDFYDFAVNDVLQGAPGFVGGIAMIAYFATKIAQSWIIAGAGIVGGSAVLKADTIVSSMGMIIS